MRRLSGPLLMATGVLDLLVCLLLYPVPLAAIAQDGFFNAVKLDPAQFDRETAFWDVTFGTMVLILGGLVQCGRRPGRVPSLPFSAGRCWLSAWSARS